MREISGPVMVLIIIGALLLLPVRAIAQAEIDWTTVDPLTGEVSDGELLVETEAAGIYPLLVIDEPGVGPPRFQIDGMIRYEGVEGVAYLEMWTVIADGSRYFTRTLAGSGPLALMTGTSAERPFSLPFELGDDGPVPASLEINLVTEGSGRFWIGPLTITSGATGTPDSTEVPPDTTPATTVDTTQVAVADTTTPGSLDEAGRLGWVPLAAAGLGAAGVLGWLGTMRRRRAEERRRMEAIDSLRP